MHGNSSTPCIATNGATAPVCIAGSHLGEARHVCAFFNSRDDEYRVTVPFIKDGFEAGDKVIHIVDPSRRSDHLQRLAAYGIDTASMQKSGQLALYDWSETFFADGPFDPDRQLELLDQALRAGREQGFPVSRYVAHAEWALQAQYVGQHMQDREEWLGRIVKVFDDMRTKADEKAVREKLLNSPTDDAETMELLRRLQKRGRGIPG